MPVAMVTHYNRIDIGIFLLLGIPIVGLLLAIFSTILGHSIFSWCLKYFSPAFVSAAKLCESVVAALLAAVIFAQIPTAMQLLGGGMILGGVAWYSRIEGREEQL